MEKTWAYFRPPGKKFRKLAEELISFLTGLVVELNLVWNGPFMSLN